MMPEGVVYHASWIDPAAARCFQVMEADSVEQLRQWASQLGRPRRLRDRARAHLAGLLGGARSHEKTGPARPDRSSLGADPASLDHAGFALPRQSRAHAKPRWCQSASGHRMRVDGSSLTARIVPNRRERSMGAQQIGGRSPARRDQNATAEERGVTGVRPSATNYPRWISAAGGLTPTAASGRRRRVADGEQVIDRARCRARRRGRALPARPATRRPWRGRPPRAAADALRQQGGDGGRERAARAVRVARVDARAHEALDAGGVAQDVDRLLARCRARP